MITIAHNYVITSVLYVFYCHRSCLLLLLSLCFLFVFFPIYLRAYRGRALPKKHYRTKAVNTVTFKFKIDHDDGTVNTDYAMRKLDRNQISIVISSIGIEATTRVTKMHNVITVLNE